MGAAQYDGRPSPQLAARLDHVVELWDAGLAPLVVVTGGKRPGDRFTEAEASARYLERARRAGECDRAGGPGAQHLRLVARRARAARPPAASIGVLLVTDPYHSLRSRLVAQELGMTAYVSPTRTSPVRGGQELRKQIEEAAGIALGRIIGFHRLLSITG